MSTTHLNGQNGLDISHSDGSLSFAGESGISKRSNALSNKLTTVLSSSYAGSEIRDALRLLDTRGAQNAEETRLNLKHDAQREIIEANAKVVDDFGKVAKQLQRVGALLSLLNQTCDDMRTHIQLAKQETAPVLEEASILLARKEETESKQQLLEAFNKHFLLSDQDLTTLTSSAEPINDQYFTVLSRVKQIHKDCEVLLGYENQRLGLELMEQTSKNLDAGYKKLYSWIQREFKGLDLEDPRTNGSIRKSLRALSDRPILFQNCLDLFGEAREVTLSDAFQTALTDSTIGSAKAIEFSTHDPLRYIGDMLAWVHSATVSEKEALEGLFISDADEISKGLNEGKLSEPWARIQRSSSTEDDTKSDDEQQVEASTFDGRAALNSLISRNMMSVSQTLQQRISLTIRNLSESLSVYKAYNLLLFYEDIFNKLLGINSESKPQQQKSQNQSQSLEPQNSLLTALSNLQSQSLSTFKALLSEDIDSQITLDAASDLSPPPILSTHLTLLSSILTLRAPTLTNTEFTILYTEILSPALEFCSEIADSLASSGGDEKTHATGAPAGKADHAEDDDDRNEANFESTLFKLNYLYLVITSFNALLRDTSLRSYITPPLRHAQQETESLQSTLTELLIDNFIGTSGIVDLVQLLASDQGTGTSTLQKRRSLLDGGEDGKLGVAATTLDTFLASALMDASDDLARLSDKRVATAVVGSAVEEFCGQFEKLAVKIEEIDRVWLEGQQTEGQGGVEGDDDGEMLLRDVYPRTVSEVRALLS